MENRRNSLIILKSTLSRLPSYYCNIEERKAAGEEYVSATSIAESLSINPVQVRKDLASICSEPGRPKLGFKIDVLLDDLKNHLGYDRYDESVLVGVGALGHVLLQYGGFVNYGLGIVAHKQTRFLSATHSHQNRHYCRPRPSCSGSCRHDGCRRHSSHLELRPNHPRPPKIHPCKKRKSCSLPCCTYHRTTSSQLTLPNVIAVPPKR